MPFPIIARAASVILAIVGAVCLAVVTVLLFMWVMDRSGVGASAVLVASGSGVAVVGAFCAWLSRRAAVVARRTPQVSIGGRNSQ
jgi:hypothetical protein